MNDMTALKKGQAKIAVEGAMNDILAFSIPVPYSLYLNFSVGHEHFCPTRSRVKKSWGVP
jgi:hypothetical protein